MFQQQVATDINGQKGNQSAGIMCWDCDNTAADCIQLDLGAYSITTHPRFAHRSTWKIVDLCFHGSLGGIDRPVPYRLS